MNSMSVTEGRFLIYSNILPIPWIQVMLLVAIHTHASIFY